jgi:ligand-binding sensor domain-containing protein
VKSIFEDEEQNIWVGFWGGGLCRLKAENYEIWINENNNKNSLSHNDVWSIHQDKSGRLWIGTNGGGLNLIEKSGFLKISFD